MASDGRTIEPKTVEEWIRKQLLDEDLERLLAEVVRQPEQIIQSGIDAVTDSSLFDDAMEAIQGQHIIRVGALASKLNQPQIAIENCLRRHQSEFGLLGEPPALVYERFAAAPEGVFRS